MAKERDLNDPDEYLRFRTISSLITGNEQYLRRYRKTPRYYDKINVFRRKIQEAINEVNSMMRE